MRHRVEIVVHGLRRISQARTVSSNSLHDFQFVQIPQVNNEVVGMLSRNLVPN
jgi:hypothetical protein